MASTPIRKKDAIKQMYEKDPTGAPMPFQIAFYTKTHKLSKFKKVPLPAAIVCGLPRKHRNKKHLIGIQPTLRGHAYTVDTRLITEFNNTSVIP